MKQKHSHLKQNQNATRYPNSADGVLVYSHINSPGLKTQPVNYDELFGGVFYSHDLDLSPTLKCSILFSTTFLGYHTISSLTN